MSAEGACSVSSRRLIWAISSSLSLDDASGIACWQGYTCQKTVNASRVGGASVESIIEKAQDNGVRIFIVHLDAQVDTSKLADDLHYWSAQ